MTILRSLLRLFWWLPAPELTLCEQKRKAWSGPIPHAKHGPILSVAEADKIRNTRIIEQALGTFDHVRRCPHGEIVKYGGNASINTCQSCYDETLLDLLTWAKGRFENHKTIH